MKKISLFFTVIFLCVKLFAQNGSGKDDLIYHGWDNIFKPVFKNEDSILRIGRLLLQDSKKNNNKQTEADVYMAIGLAYNYKGELDSAILFYKKAKNIFYTSKNDEAEGYTDIALAKIYIAQYKIDTALLYLFRVDSLSVILNNTTMQADVKWNLGLVYKNEEDYLSAARYFKMAQHTFYLQKQHSKYIIAGCNLSMAYRLMDQNDSSLHVLAQCMSVFNKQLLTDSLLFASIQENYGDTYLEMEKYPEAITHFNEALLLNTKYNRTYDIAYQEYSIGMAFTQMNRFDDAEKYLLQSYKVFDSLKNYKSLVWASNILNILYAKMKDWPNAYYYLAKRDAWSDTIGIMDQIKKANALNRKFEVAKKETEIAVLQSQNQLIKWWFISGILLTFIIVFIIWINSYRKKVEEEKILNYFATSLYNQNTVDDVFWDIAKNCVSKLHLEDCVIYVYNEPRTMLLQKAAYGPKNPSGYQISNYLEIPVGKGIVGSVAQSLIPEIIDDVKNDKSYISDDKTRASEITVPILVEGKLIGIIDSENSKKGFYSKRHLRIFQKIADICSKKITRHLVEESLRKDIARDLHDDIGSALTSINITSKIALQKEKQQIDVTAYLEKINIQSGSMMDSMGDIIWAIKPGNNNFENTFAHIKEFASELCEPIDINLQFDFPDMLNPVIITSDIRKNVFLIFKECINNAVKYSNCTIVSTEFSKNENGQIAMKIKDNGCGFDEAIIKHGNGLMNMRERARQINGTLHISNALPGTVVELLFTI